MSDVDRRFSNGIDWDNSIDIDDASDGSEGGYDRYGGYINAHGMMEIIKLRVENAALRAQLDACLNVKEPALMAYENVLKERDALRALLQEARDVCAVFLSHDGRYAAKHTLDRITAALNKGGGDE